MTRRCKDTQKASEITRAGFQILPISYSLCVLCAFFTIFAVSSFAQNHLEILAEKIRSGNTEQKRDALFQIRNLESEEASRLAIPALRDSEIIVRATAAYSVIYLPRDEAAQVLLPLLLDKSELVRRETAYALGKVGDVRAVVPLLATLQKDKIAEVRNAAVTALGEIGEPRAVGELIRILQQNPKEKDAFLRRAAARSIGQIAQIIQTNEERVVTPESFLPGDRKNLQKPKYLHLKQEFPIFGQALAVLVNILQNEKEDDDTRREAAYALGLIGDLTALPVLQTHLNSEDYYLAEIAKESIVKIEFRQMLREKENK